MPTKVPGFIDSIAIDAAASAARFGAVAGITPLLISEEDAAGGVIAGGTATGTGVSATAVGGAVAGGTASGGGISATTLGIAALLVGGGGAGIGAAAGGGGGGGSTPTVEAWLQVSLGGTTFEVSIWKEGSSFNRTWTVAEEGQGPIYVTLAEGDFEIGTYNYRIRFVSESSSEYPGIFQLILYYGLGSDMAIYTHPLFGGSILAPGDVQTGTFEFELGRFYGTAPIGY